MHPFEVVRCALRLLNVQRLQSLRVCGVAVPGAGISLATRCGKFTILLLNKCKNSPLVKKNPLPAHLAHSLPLRCCTSCVLFKFLETGFKLHRGRGFRAGDWGAGRRSLEGTDTLHSFWVNVGRWKFSKSPAVWASLRFASLAGHA